MNAERIDLEFCFTFQELESAIDELISNGRGIGFLSWEFLGSEYEGTKFVYNKDLGKIFAEYLDKNKEIGTFVLDRNTLANNFKYLLIKDEAQ